ncbi:MAG: S8 family serine peptidase [Opitutaceae bacterium]
MHAATKWVGLGLTVVVTAVVFLRISSPGDEPSPRRAEVFEGSPSPQVPASSGPVADPKPAIASLVSLSGSPSVLLDRSVRRDANGYAIGAVEISRTPDLPWPVRSETSYPPCGSSDSTEARSIRMVADQFLVGLAPEADPAEAITELRNLGIDARVATSGSTFLVARIGDFEHEDSLPLSIEAARRVLGERATAIEPDYLVTTHLITPNDPSFGQQWALASGGTNAGIQAPAGWTIDHNAGEVVVAVIDSGIRVTHRDLRENLWTNPREVPGNGIDDDNNGYVDDIHGINTISGDGDPSDLEGHGTHVAGIIGARGNNGIGISGVAWEIDLMALRFIGANGEGATSDAVEAIDYAINNGAHVINASWGGPGRSGILEAAIRRAGSAGIIFVTSAGNSGRDIDVSPEFPAGFDLPSLVAVASVIQNGQLSSFSNFGYQRVALAAPGSDILSCLAESDDAYGYASGTSMAAPHVAGIAALLRSTFGPESAEDLIDRLYRTSRAVSFLASKVTGGGVVDLARSLSDSSSAPINDNFEDAVAATGSTFRYFGTTSFATGQAGEANPFSQSRIRSVWFQLTVPDTTKVRLRSSSTQFESGVTIYRGNALANLATVTSGSGSEVDLSFEAIGGLPYRIRIEPINDRQGLYQLDVSIPAANDAFARAALLTGDSFNVSADNRLATRETAEPSHAGLAPNRSLWWSWTAPRSGYFVVSTFGSDHDTTLAVYQGDSLSGLSLVAANDNSAEGVVFSSVAFNPVAGQTYRIVADSTSPAGGMVRIQGTFDTGVRFVVQPEDSYSTEGATAVFNARAEGRPPILYQWLKDGDPIAGATGTQLKLSSITSSDLGGYRLQATGPEAQAFSREARLYFGGHPPRIETPPVAGSYFVGESIRLSVRVRGVGPISLQWLLNGQPITGETGDSLIRTSAQPSNSGLYSLKASNAFGSVESDRVRITVTAPTPEGWHFRFPSSTPGISMVSWLNNRFFAYGSLGTVYSSTDGETWQRHPYLNKDDRIEEIIYGNNRYLVRDSFGRLRVVGEDLDFSAAPMANGDFSAARIVFDSGLFVAATLGGMKTSLDGLAWTERAAPFSRLPDYLARLNDRFVAIWFDSTRGGRATIAYSLDGINWTDPTAVNTDYYETAAVVDGALHLIRSWDSSIRTTDGINWEPGPVLVGDMNRIFIHQGRLYALEVWSVGTGAPFFEIGPARTREAARTIASDITSVAFGNDRFVVVNRNGDLHMLQPEPGIPTPSAPLPGPTYYASAPPRLSFVNGRFYVMGSDSAASDDGAHWEIHDYTQGLYMAPGRPAEIEAIEYGNGVYTTGALSGPSPDYLEPGLNDNPWVPSAIVFGDGIFAGIAYNSVITSTNGRDWTDHSFSPPYGFEDIAFGGGRFVAVGGNIIATSSGPDAWTQIEIPYNPTDQHTTMTGVAYGLGEFVVTTTNGVLYRSRDGLNWTRFVHGFPGDSGNSNDLPSLADITFGDGVFMVVGHRWIFRSGNLDQWTRSPAPVSSLDTVAYGNGTFVAATSGIFLQLGQQPNAVPLVAFEEPTAELTVARNAIQHLRIRASDPEGRLIGIRLLANGSEIASSSTGLLELDWTPPTSGTFGLLAEARDADGMTSTDAIGIRVREPNLQPVSYRTRPRNAIDAVLFKDQYFVLDTQGNLWRSSNLEDWSVVFFPDVPGARRELVANEDVLLIRSSPDLALTRDGLSFVEVGTPYAGRSIDHLSTDGADGFLMENEGIFTSFDGVEWLPVGISNYGVDLMAMNKGSIITAESRWESATLRRPDGGKEALPPPAESEWFRSLFAHGGHFYLKGDTWVARSIDGHDWKVWQLGQVDYSHPTGAFTDGKAIVLYGGSADPLVTTDQIHWQTIAVKGLSSIVRFNGSYYGTTWQTVYRSDDLVHWDVVHRLPEHGGTVSSSKLVTGPAGMLVCPADGVGLGYTRDGSVWVQEENLLPWDYTANLVNLAQGNGVWVASTYNFGVKTGATLSRLEPSGTDLKRAFFDGTRFVATSISDNNAVYFSPDGRVWQKQAVVVPPKANLETLFYLKDSNRYVVAVNADLFATTADFVTWTTGEFRDRFSGNFYELNGHVISNFDGGFRHTTDGVNWHRVALKDQYGWLYWANGTYLLAIGYDRVAVSTDLQDWTVHPLPGSLPSLQYMRIIPTADGFFADDQSYSDISRSFFSPDGIHWQPATLPGRYRYTTPVLVNGTWYYLDNDVLALVETDLELAGVSAPADTFGADDPIDLQIEIRNASDEPINVPEGLPVAAFLAEDRIWSPRTDTGLGTVQTGPIAIDAGKSEIQTIRFIIPADVPPGLHGVAVWLDAGNHIPEQNEFNNYAWSDKAEIDIPERRLTTSSDGGGTIDILPFRQRYANKARVTLVPIESPGFAFSGWEGVTESHLDTATIRMNTDREVTAHFARALTLRTEVLGAGVVEVHPDEGVFPPGAAIRLSARSEPNWAFRGWSGDQSGPEADLGFTIEHDTRVVARFHQSAAAWKSRIFTAEQQHDPAISSDLADPDNDGSVNQAEFLFGTDPLDPASVPWVGMIPNDRGTIVRFPVRALIDLEPIGIEISRDMQTWVPLDVSLSPILMEPGAGTDLVEIEIQDDVAPPPFFIRFVLNPVAD